MPASTTLIVFALTTVALVATPGPNLVYLSVRAWRSAPPLTDAAPSASTAVSGSSMRRAVLRGFTVNALNPKVALFFLAPFPQSTTADAGPAWVQMFVLGFVFVALAMTIDLAFAVASGSVGRWLACRPRLAGSQPRVTGAVYLGIALGAAADTGQR